LRQRFWQLRLVASGSLRVGRNEQRFSIKRYIGAEQIVNRETARISRPNFQVAMIAAPLDLSGGLHPDWPSPSNRQGILTVGSQSELPSSLYPSRHDPHHALGLSATYPVSIFPARFLTLPRRTTARVASEHFSGRLA